MAGTGLPIPKSDNVLTQPVTVLPASVFSIAAAWNNIAASGERLASESANILQKEVHQSQVAQIADFETNWRAKRIEARDKFSNDPVGFKTWSDATIEGALGEVPAWMAPHAKQFLSREFESAHASILGERRALDQRMDTQAIVARTKMADDDVMAIAAAGKLNTPEGKAAIQTYQGVLNSAVGAELMAPDHAQLLTEDLTTRAQGTVIRNSVEQVYREKGYEAARAHLDESLQQFGTQYRVTDKIRTQTLGWLRSEEAGMRGERDGISREWAAAKPNLATLSPDALAEMQNRAYAVGAFRVGDEIQANVSALNIVRQLRQLPVADQVRVLASGSFEARLSQRENASGDPRTLNQFGYVGNYQFGAPRLATLGLYQPGANENLGAWSRTPANAPGKWSGTFNIPGFPEVKTLEQFRASPEAQRAAFQVHQQRTDQEIEQFGLGQFIGQSVGGVEITRDGLRAMIHLGGAEGARAALTSGGRVNPRDANGTSLLDYARLGTGDLTQSRGGLIAMNMLRKDLTQDLSKKITEFQSAVNKTEFPPMDEIGALVGQVGFLGTEEQKRQVAEMAAQAEYGARFVQLPKAQRDEIVSRWNEKVKTGATQYERHLADTVRAADGRVTAEFAKDPYGAAYRFKEGYKALPAVDWSSPTVGDLMAAKVAQQNTLRADEGIPVFSALRPGEAAALGAQLVNGDPRQSRAIIDMLARTLPDDIYKATIGDAPVRQALDGMVRSYDPDKLNIAMSVLDRAYRSDPIGFKETFKDDTLRRLQTWQARKDQLTPIAMAEHFKRADDPAFAAARKNLEAEADKKLGDMTPASVANELGSAADRWVPFVNQAAPVDPLAAQALAGEYTQLFKERYVDTQNVDRAKEQTVERLRTVWGPSTVAGGALMRHPPERFYPQVDGSHEWMKRDIEAAITASRLGAGTVDRVLPGVTPDIPGAPLTAEAPAFTYKVMADARTEADVAARRPPSYVVMVKDLASGRDTIPLDWAGNPMRFTFDPANAQAAARERFMTERERQLNAPNSLSDAPTAQTIPPGGEEGESAQKKSERNVVQRAFLGALDQAERAGVGGTAVRLYNDVVQRGRTATITEKDLLSSDLTGLEGLVRAHAAESGGKSGKIDYRDYQRLGSGLDSNIIGGFKYSIDDNGTITVTDTYDFNTDRGRPGDDSTIMQAVAAFMNPRGLAAVIGRNTVPDTGDKGIPIEIRIPKGKA